MRIKNLYKIFAAAVFTACLASCSQDEFLISESDGTQALTVTVTDGGYQSDGGTPTRAAENGYATVFTAGDACGLYIVDGGKTVVSNLKIVATEVDGVPQWKTADGTDIYVDKAAGASYFLYYPYQAADDMEGKTDVSATTDDQAFFAPLIEEWQPKTDQSDYATGYSASDLMTATGSVSGNSISFNMTHRMALTVIDLPGTVYQFTDPTIPDYTVQGSAEFTGEAKPCRMTDGTYRYIVNPALCDQPQVTGIYADGKKEFSFNPSDLTASTYKTYKVDGGISASSKQDYDLQVGDYFLVDGRLLTKDTDLGATTLTDKIIGLVFNIGRNSRDKSDYTIPLTVGGPTLGTTVHGYVVAITEAHNTTLFWEQGPNNEKDRRVYASTDNADWNGYNNHKKIKEFLRNNTSSGWELKHFPAAFVCETYGKRTIDLNGNTTNDFDWQKSFVAPHNTSGWFLPSLGQLRRLRGQRDFLNQQLSKVKKLISDDELKRYVNFNDDGLHYWSSSESNTFNNSAWGICFRTGQMIEPRKDYHGYARAILAF